MSIVARGAAAAVMVGILGAGCASWDGEGTTEGPIANRATVEVANHHWQDINVYAVHGAMRVRLGTVTSMRTTEFRLPAVAGMMGRIQLVAAPIGSMRSYVTEPIMLREGDRIEWSVENPLTLSSHRVASR